MIIFFVQSLKVREIVIRIATAMMDLYVETTIVLKVFLLDLIVALQNGVECTIHKTTLVSMEPTILLRISPRICFVIMKQ